MLLTCLHSTIGLLIITIHYSDFLKFKFRVNLAGYLNILPFGHPYYTYCAYVRIYVYFLTLLLKCLANVVSSSVERVTGEQPLIY